MKVLLLLLLLLLLFTILAHADVCSILRNRLKLLQEVRSEWSLSEPKVMLSLSFIAIFSY